MFHERRREKIGYAGKIVICTTWLKSEIGTYKKDTLKAYKQANRMLNRRIHFYFNWEQMSKLNNSLSLKIWNEWQVNNFDDNLFAFKVTGRASVISEKLDGHKRQFRILFTQWLRKQRAHLHNPRLVKFRDGLFFSSRTSARGARTERGLHAWKQMNRAQNSRER